MLFSPGIYHSVATENGEQRTIECVGHFRGASEKITSRQCPERGV